MKFHRFPQTEHHGRPMGTPSLPTSAVVGESRRLKGKADTTPVGYDAAGTSPSTLTQSIFTSVSESLHPVILGDLNLHSMCLTLS